MGHVSDFAKKLSCTRTTYTVLDHVEVAYVTGAVPDLQIGPRDVPRCRGRDERCLAIVVDVSGAVGQRWSGTEEEAGQQFLGERALAAESPVELSVKVDSTPEGPAAHPLERRGTATSTPQGQHTSAGVCVSR